MKPWILVVDDEDTIRKLLKSRLERDGHQVQLACNASEAEAFFETGSEIGVMVTDLKMPGKDGLELMKWAREKDDAHRAVVITGHGEKEVAVQSLRLGASDYLEKPFDMDELSHSVRRCLREYNLEKENKELVGRLEARIERVEGRSEDKYWYVSQAQAMEPVNNWIKVLHRESMRGEAEEPPALILGESGTGKEGIARMIHAGSRCARGPWVAVNCANFSESLLASELFGHEKGSFTGATGLKRGLFEIAKNGTLLLDEIGEMDAKLQAQLLRVLQEKTFRRVGGTEDLTTDVRIIAATNQDLQLLVKEGGFREDLYHRLACVVLDVPPLRQRPEDITPMAVQFAERSFRARGKAFEGFAPDAEKSLYDYSWPGNVRELLNVIERVALVWESHGPVSVKTLGLPASSVKVGDSIPYATTGPKPVDEESYIILKKKWVKSFEQEYLNTLLNRYDGNVSAASRAAQMDRSNFLRLLRRHRLHAREFRKAA